MYCNFKSLRQFEATIIRQVQQGFDGRTTNSENDWNYFGAVLYAVTLISTIGKNYIYIFFFFSFFLNELFFRKGYGHITTKTTQGKIATILYSAFGVPLMMLFVANIGSTMAKLFTFVFRRITMIFCCRITNKKKHPLALKTREKFTEKNCNFAVATNEKLPISILNEEKKDIEMITKSNLQLTADEHIQDLVLSNQINSSMSESITNSTTNVNISTDLKKLPADVRLNMLTGVPNSNTSRSLTSSINSIGEKSKHAIVRINELIRQSSVQNIEEINNDERKRRRSVDINPIQYYINETNKLTSNLDDSTKHQSIISMGQSEILSTNQNEINMKQVKMKFYKYRNLIYQILHISSNINEMLQIDFFENKVQDCSTRLSR